MFEPRYGAVPLPEGGVRFRVFAPCCERVAVKILGARPSREELSRCEGGPERVFEGTVRNAGPGTDYVLVLEGPLGSEIERPDPASRLQPLGVHGPSRVVDPEAFRWTDAAWRGIPLEEHVIYELHVGTFTPEGTFAAVASKIPYLRDLGVTAIELMPLAAFPGERNWGYDGAYPYAVQASYGGPLGLKALVDAAHAHGIAVVIDFVMNHLGPEGSYLGDFGPVFTERYRTPWGRALNFDGPESDEVRRFFIDAALHWLHEFHADALRVDAIHGIFDFSARHVLEELTTAFHDAARRIGRTALLFAESDLNDVRTLLPREAGGLGFDAQWSDDFHHAVYAALTGERRGYFGDFGRLEDVRKAIAEGFVYDGRHSKARRRRHGSSAALRPGGQFVVCIENHDQVANGSLGARLASLLSFEELKLAAALLLSVPNVPLLFMGQEWAEDRPFLYFTSHGDPELARAVTEGRRAELGALARASHLDTVSSARGSHVSLEELASFDPQDPSSFERSKLDWSKLERARHREMLALYRDLLALRRSSPPLRDCRRDLARVISNETHRWLMVERRTPALADGRALFLANFGDRAVDLPIAVSQGYELALSTTAARYGGGGDELSRRLPAPTGSVHLAASSAAIYLAADSTPAGLL